MAASPRIRSASLATIGLGGTPAGCIRRPSRCGSGSVRPAPAARLLEMGAWCRATRSGRDGSARENRTAVRPAGSPPDRGRRHPPAHRPEFACALGAGSAARQSARARHAVRGSPALRSRARSTSCALPMRMPACQREIMRPRPRTRWLDDSVVANAEMLLSSAAETPARRARGKTSLKNVSASSVLSSQQPGSARGTRFPGRVVQARQVFAQRAHSRCSSLGARRTSAADGGGIARLLAVTNRRGQILPSPTILSSGERAASGAPARAGTRCARPLRGIGVIDAPFHHRRVKDVAVGKTR